MTELTRSQKAQITRLDSLTITQLRKKHERLTGKAASTAKRATLIKRCAAAIRKTTTTPDRRRRALDVGTVLTRTHKGQEITVTVTESGFEYDGETYSSLSTLAKAITGYHISGPAFFKLARK
jgi:hypothetical protein